MKHQCRIQTERKISKCRLNPEAHPRGSYATFLDYKTRHENARGIHTTNVWCPTTGTHLGICTDDRDALGEFLLQYAPDVECPEPEYSPGTMIITMDGRP